MLFRSRAHLTKGTKLASGSCVRESETLFGKPSSAPMRVCSGKQCFPVFSPRSMLALGPRRFWAASCYLCTGALLVVVGAGNQLQTCSTLGRRRMGPEKALSVWPQHPTLCNLGRAPARAHLRKGTILDSGSCIRESETLLGKPS